MDESVTVCCPVCESVDHRHYISTHALMHSVNTEWYRFNICTACESVFLTNTVSEFELKAYYTPNYLPYKGAAAWGRYSSFVAGSQRKLDRKRVQVVAGIANGKKEFFSILDVGCGQPSFLELVQAKLNATCIGIDFSDNGWKDHPYPTLQLIKTSLEDFAPSQSFDVITLWHYLEHDYHLHETIEKLHTCLNPGGKLIIEVPDYQSVSARRQKQSWQGWHSPRHLTLFSEKGFRILFPADKWIISKHLKYGTLDAFTLYWLGKMEQKHINWFGSMEREFWPLVFFKVLSFPFFAFERFFSMGLQLIIVEKK
jgi:predicted SAM-dependent methyltransferase